jgi:DNA-binding protein HU-beta
MAERTRETAAKWGPRVREEDAGPHSNATSTTKRIWINLRGRHAMATTATKVETVTLKHLAAQLAEEHELPKKQAEAILNDMVGLIAKHLKKGARVRVPGLGILLVRKRAARMGRNPATGEAIKIKASKKVAFRVAKELKEGV